MKNLPRTALCFSFVLILCAFTSEAYALPILPFPNANQLTGPVFIQPSVGLAMISKSGGVGRTEEFFSDLLDTSLPKNRVVHILQLSGP
jgi:hypothetical protein